MRLSFGPINSGGGKADNGTVVEVPIETNDDVDEQCGLDTNIELLVLGRGERRACCNCDFDGKFDNRTLFLHSKFSIEVMFFILYKKNMIEEKTRNRY